MHNAAFPPVDAYLVVLVIALQCEASPGELKRCRPLLGSGIKRVTATPMRPRAQLIIIRSIQEIRTPRVTYGVPFTLSFT